MATPLLDIFPSFIYGPCFVCADGKFLKTLQDMYLKSQSQNVLSDPSVFIEDLQLWMPWLTGALHSLVNI